MLRIVLRFFGFVFSWAAIGSIMALAALAAVFAIYGKDLPDYAQLENYAPATLSRIYSGQGRLMDEFARERRIFTPIDEIPDRVKDAFISAEDKNFYEHHGFDPRGIAAAVYDAAVNGGRLRGASTITQQVMKNFLLTGDRSGERKIKEIILATRLESTLSKNEILQLYLNEIFLGQNSYGVTAAAQVYFAKSLDALSLAESAYLAALPQAPSELHPVRNEARAVARRNYVLDQMADNGYVTRADADAAKAEALVTVQGGADRLGAQRDAAAGLFHRRDPAAAVGEVRRRGALHRGPDDPRDGRSRPAGRGGRRAARGARGLRSGAEGLSRAGGADRSGELRSGGRGELAQGAGRDAGAARHRRLARGGGARGRREPGRGSASRACRRRRAATSWALRRRRGRGCGPATAAGCGRRRGRRTSGRSATWSSSRRSRRMARSTIGPTGRSRRSRAGSWRWTPRPGACWRCRAGFSYQSSVFNRATQALRQPGSSFKPFVYAAALDNGYSPATIVLDAPIEVATGAGIWKPENSGNTYYGPTPMRTGIEQSRNLMTVRIAQDVGMDVVAAYGERFGIYDNMPPLLSYSLGAGETTLYKMVTAYAELANGGLKVEPTLVDRVQDRYGKTIYRHDQRPCEGCTADDVADATEPRVHSDAARVMDAITAYQVTSMLQGAVARGTSAASVGQLHLNLAGKTGTTNEAKDVWYIGYSPRIVAGCYLGYDTPRPLGKSAFGGTLCAPIFVEFIKKAMAGQGPVSWAVPPGGHFINIDRHTGQRLPDTASGSNVQAEYIRDGQDLMVGAYGDTIDAGWKMGADVPLFDDVRNSPQIERVQVRGQTRALPSNPSLGSMSSGGLY